MSEKIVMLSECVMAKDLDAVVDNAVFTAKCRYEDMQEMKAKVSSMLSVEFQVYKGCYERLRDYLFALKTLHIFSQDYLDGLIKELSAEHCDFFESLSGGKQDEE